MKDSLILHRFIEEGGEFLWDQYLAASPQIGSTMRFAMTSRDLDALRKAHNQSSPIYDRASANRWLVREVHYDVHPQVSDNHHGHFKVEGLTTVATVVLVPVPVSR